MCETPVIAIVDDDEAVRVATGSLVRSLGYTAETYASAGDFLRACAEREPACLITDVQMPGMSGVELQQSLIAAGRRLPVIFVTAFPTESVRARPRGRGQRLPAEALRRRHHHPLPPARPGGPGHRLTGGDPRPPQNVGGVQALMISQGAAPTQRKRCGRRLSK
jgi:CheY-like chemotaxis protein